MVVRVGQAEAGADQAGAVGGQGFALSPGIGGVGGDVVREGEDGEVHIVLVGKVLQVQLGGGALLDANGASLEFQDGGDAQGLGHHETLAVVEHSRGEVAPLEIAGGGPGGVAGHHIHLAGLHNRAALGGGGGANFYGIGVAEDGGGHGPAEVDVETDDIAAFVQDAEPGNGVVAGADQDASGAYQVKAAGVAVRAVVGGGGGFHSGYGGLNLRLDGGAYVGSGGGGGGGFFLGGTGQGEGHKQGNESGDQQLSTGHGVTSGPSLQWDSMSTIVAQLVWLA